MPHPTRRRQRSLLAASRRAPVNVRAFHAVLAVALMAILSSVCCVLLGSIIDLTASASIRVQPS